VIDALLVCSVPILVSGSETLREFWVAEFGFSAVGDEKRRLDLVVSFVEWWRTHVDAVFEHVQVALALESLDFQ
jgi:hypothetical protein